MRTLIRALPLALAAAFLALFALACKTGDGGAGDLVSADPAAALGASAESFEAEVNSLQADLAVAVNAGGFKVEANADMAFQAPARMHMTMELAGLGAFEMVLLGTDLYVNMPGRGWVAFSLGDEGLSEFGLDATRFDKLVSDHSMVDYYRLIDNLGGDVEDMGEETLDDGTFHHYRATLDFGDVAAAFSDAFGATSSLGLDSLRGPVTLDVWLHPDTALPHRIAAEGVFPFGTDRLTFNATMRFFGYNEPVEIPGAPPDAVPYALLGGP